MLVRMVEATTAFEPSVTQAWRPKQGPISRLKNEPEFRPMNSKISGGGDELKQLRSANSFGLTCLITAFGRTVNLANTPTGFEP